jgi:hypothetical protein
MYDATMHDSPPRLAAGIESGDCRSAFGLQLMAYRICESAICSLKYMWP